MHDDVIASIAPAAYRRSAPHHGTTTTGTAIDVFTTMELRDGAGRAAGLAGRAGPERDVKPPPFAYHAPATVDEAVDLLAASRRRARARRRPEPRAADEAAPGQAVGAGRRQRRRRASTACARTAARCVVGALVRQQSLLDDARRARLAPLVGQATRYVGYRTTRHRGTVGGSLAYAAPWAELPGVVRRARRHDRGALRARRAAPSPRATSSATRTPPRSSRTSC